MGVCTFHKNCCENKEQIINIQQSFRLLNQENIDERIKLKGRKNSNTTNNTLNKISKKQVMQQLKHPVQM